MIQEATAPFCAEWKFRFVTVEIFKKRLRFIKSFGGIRDGLEFRNAREKHGPDHQNQSGSKVPFFYHARNWDGHVLAHFEPARNPTPIRIMKSDRNCPLVSPAVSGASGSRNISPSMRSRA